MKTEREDAADESPDVALTWARRCAGGMSAAEKVEFQAWLAASPRHARDLARANRGGVDCDWAWQSGAVDEVMSGVASRVRRQRVRRTALAGVAMLLAVSVILGRLNRTSGVDEASLSVANLAVIRPAVQTLPDGSVVELKDGARILTDFGGVSRIVALSNGAAFFQVVRDVNRPFVVKAGGLAVQAVGTSFEVELERGELRVLVADGKVRVDPSDKTSPRPAPVREPLLSLGAGDSVVFPLATGPITKPTLRTLDSTELQQRLGWRIPKLEFTRTPLSEVIAQMNRYNARKFILGEKSVGEVRVSGILRADKMETLAETLENDFGVRVERRTDETVLWRRK